MEEEEEVTEAMEVTEEAMEAMEVEMEAEATEVEVEGKEATEVGGREVMAEAGEEEAIAATSFLATTCISGEDHNHLIGPCRCPAFFLFVLKVPWQVNFFADCAGALPCPSLYPRVRCSLYGLAGEMTVVEMICIWDQESYIGLSIEYTLRNVGSSI